MHLPMKDKRALSTATAATASSTRTHHDYNRSRDHNRHLHKHTIITTHSGIGWLWSPPQSRAHTGDLS